MPFFDLAAYTTHVLDQNTLKSGLVAGLAFDSSKRQVVSLTTSGLISVHDLSSIEQPGKTLWQRRVPAPANSIAITSAGFCIGSDKGLFHFDSQTGPPSPIFDDVGVVALSKVPGHDFVAAVRGGWLVRIDEEHGKPAAVVGEQSEFSCITPLSGNAHSFIAACNDGTARQYDFRVGRQAVKKINLNSGSRITCIAASDDGAFIMAGTEDRNMASAHLSTSSVVATRSTAYIPRAVACSEGRFYCGGSDHKVKSDPALEVINLKCEPAGTGTTPVSTSSIYTIVADSQSGAIAAGGYTRMKLEGDGAGECVDVYIDPPVRSFTFQI